MFDLQNDDTTRVKHARDPMAEDVGEEDIDALEEDEHPLDSYQNEELHRQLMATYRMELDRQYENRAQMAIDEDFYDNIQWDEDDAEVLRERGQAPLVFNVISQSVNWIIGSEKRGRVDFKILPRTKEDAKPAERKTSLLKYLSDVNRTTFHRSRAFEDATKVGVGWLEDGVQDDDQGEPVYSRYESWRNMLWDSAATEMDLKDCRFVSRSKWVDLDIAVAIAPDRRHLLERSAADADAYGTDGIGRDADEAMDSIENHLEMGIESLASHAYNRQRVRMIEMWFRIPKTVQRIVQGQFAGEEYDENNPGHQQAMENGEAFVGQRLDLRMHVALMTPLGLVALEESPYKHNRFPFTPIWGNRRGRDGMPYGVIRGMRDLQEDINKRASKALYILSSNKVVMDEGAVDDIEEFRREVARPDAIIEKRPGKEMNLNVDRGLEQAHFNLMMQDISMIQQVSGVTDELLGRQTNAQSGKAVEARQNQGMMSTAKLFDNMRFAIQMQGEIQLSLIEQYFTEQKTFRITNQRGTPDFVDVNDGLPDNDIVRSKADFVISEDEWRATLRQAAAEELMEMITRMPPEVSIVMLDLVVEAMDIPNRDELVKRIRAINGQRDPDATELTPEEKQRIAQQQKQQQIQQMQVEAEIRKALAEAGKTEAEAQKIAAELVESRVDTQKAGIEAAQQALTAPGAARIADTLLREAGFVTKSEQEAALAQAQREEQMAQEQAAQEQAAMQQQRPQQPGAVPNGGIQQQRPGGMA